MLGSSFLDRRLMRWDEWTFAVFFKSGTAMCFAFCSSFYFLFNNLLCS